MATLLQLPKRFHRAFISPNKVLTFNAEIDWSNPLAKDLVVFYPLGGTQRMVNLADPTSQASVNGSFAAHTPIGFVNSSLIGNNLELLNSGRYCIGNNLTIFIQTDNLQDGASGSPGIFGNRNSASDNNWISVNAGPATDNIRVFFKDGSSETLLDVSGIDTKVPHIFAVTRKGDELILYVDGERRGSIDEGARSAFTANQNFRIGTYFNAAANRTISGDFNNAGIFQRALSDAEHRLLAQNTHALLKPLTLPTYFTPADAPPAGRIMSSLAKNGGLAGLGGIAGPGGGLAG